MGSASRASNNVLPGRQHHGRHEGSQHLQDGAQAGRQGQGEDPAKSREVCQDDGRDLRGAPHELQHPAGQLHQATQGHQQLPAMQTASKNLMETLSDIYEKEWVGQDMLYVQAQNHEMLWAALAHKLSDQVVIPLNTNQAQFPEMRKKIDKRGRKLIDFDAERHAVQQMQNNPNRNEAKFVRAKESMENAKRTYEVLNSELHDELPALHDSRILFLVTNMQTLFAAEEVFHSETAKVFSELEAVVDKLAKEVQKGTLPRKTFPKPLPITNHSSNSNLSNNVISTNGNNTSSPPKGATTDNLPPGVLYQVKAAYKYQAEDMDELQFEVGEVIDVVEYEDPEEQEEGWLMGVRSSTGQKGLFPANFTRPI